MEDLEQQTKVMNLGKLLVKELDLEDSTDTLSRWMAHYLAEKILLVESALPSEETEKVKKDCFETILSVWKQRWLLPAGKRPLEDFEPILQTLQRLGPDRTRPYFFQVIFEDSFETADDPHANEAVSSGLEQAMQIDKAARIWIEQVLSDAVNRIDNASVRTIVKNAFQLPESADVNVIRILSRSIDKDDKDEEDTFQRRYRRDELKQRIHDLEQFRSLNEMLLGSYRKEWEELKNSD
jgi:hypothetical protein